ncbi:MAG: hypothetical protein BGO32_00850 [Bacteroidetes bacterium 37-13]|nr:MAG: hypothetical protein BGO32_00850 [Bacteroidetes bacterium 37-13]
MYDLHISAIALISRHQSIIMKHSLTEGMIIISLVFFFWGIGLRMISDSYLALGNMIIVSSAVVFGYNYYQRFIKK